MRFGASALIGAQLSQEIGTAFHDGDINRTAQLIAHTATGCVAGAVGTCNCSANAVAQVTGEIASIIHGDLTVDDIDDVTQNWAENNIDMARLSGALAAAVAGGDADDVNLGADAGGVAAENNALFVPLVILAASYYGTMSAAQVITGLDVLGEDPVGKAISEGINGAVTISNEAYPDQTQATLAALATAQETAGIAVTYIDEKTGNVVSKNWNNLSEANQNRLIGGVGLVSATIPATGITRLSAIKSTGAINTGKLLKNIEGFNTAEVKIINEAKTIISSSQLNILKEAYVNGKPATVNINERTIQYEPNLPASGMTLFGDDGFLLDQEAFVSSTEFNKTILHELHRLNTSKSNSGVSNSIANQETKNAFDFAEKASEIISNE